MNYEEEQSNELEALSEIYYNEIKVISNRLPISFSIKIRPQASSYEEFDNDNKSDGEDDNESEEENSTDEDAVEDIASKRHNLFVEIKFDLPSKYPEHKPVIEIVGSQNLDEQELEDLSGHLDQKAEECLGTVMVFTLVSDVVEWLITKSEREANELEQEKEKRQQEIRAEEIKRFEGIQVTVETFNQWKVKFDAEMLKAKLEQQKHQATTEGSGYTRRLTGREMFESDKTLAESDLNFVEDLDQNQLEALLHNIDEFELGEDDGDFDPDFDEDTDDDDDGDDGDDDEDLDFEESDEEEAKGKSLKTCKKK